MPICHLSDPNCCTPVSDMRMARVRGAKYFSSVLLLLIFNQGSFSVGDSRLKGEV